MNGKPGKTLTLLKRIALIGGAVLLLGLCACQSAEEKELEKARQKQKALEQMAAAAEREYNDLTRQLDEIDRLQRQLGY